MQAGISIADETIKTPLNSADKNEHHGGHFLPEIPDIETSVGAAGGQDRLIVRRPLYLMNVKVGHWQVNVVTVVQQHELFVNKKLLRLGGTSEDGFSYIKTICKCRTQMNSRKHPNSVTISIIQFLTFIKVALCHVFTLYLTKGDTNVQISP